MTIAPSGPLALNSETPEVKIPPGWIPGGFEHSPREVLQVDIAYDYEEDSPTLWERVCEKVGSLFAIF